MTRKLVRVTQEHIERGVKKSCTYCPIGLAMHEAGIEESLFQYLWRMEPPMPPDSVRRFIMRFDQGKPVEPFNFYYLDLELA